MLGFSIFIHLLKLSFQFFQCFSLLFVASNSSFIQTSVLVHSWIVIDNFLKYEYCYIFRFQRTFFPTTTCLEVQDGESTISWWFLVLSCFCWHFSSIFLLPLSYLLSDHSSKLRSLVHWWIVIDNFLMYKYFYTFCFQKNFFSTITFLAVQDRKSTIPCWFLLLSCFCWHFCSIFYCLSPICWKYQFFYPNRSHKSTDELLLTTF